MHFVVVWIIIFEKFEDSCLQYLRKLWTHFDSVLMIFTLQVWIHPHFLKSFLAPFRNSFQPKLITNLPNSAGTHSSTQFSIFDSRNSKIPVSVPGIPPFEPPSAQDSKTGNWRSRTSKGASLTIFREMYHSRGRGRGGGCARKGRPLGWGGKVSLVAAVREGCFATLPLAKLGRSY